LRDACTENKIECKNGGQCTTKKGQWICNCPQDYVGAFCEERSMLEIHKKRSERILQRGADVVNPIADHLHDDSSALYDAALRPLDRAATKMDKLTAKLREQNALDEAAELKAKREESLASVKQELVKAQQQAAQAAQKQQKDAAAAVAAANAVPAVGVASSAVPTPIPEVHTPLTYPEKDQEQQQDQQGVSEQYKQLDAAADA
jgi:hypothetical protein